MKTIIWILVAALVVLHQANWMWSDRSLWLDAFPVGLVFHVGISLAASLLWWLATRYAWPVDETSPAVPPVPREQEADS